MRTGRQLGACVAAAIVLPIPPHASSAAGAPPPPVVVEVNGGGFHWLDAAVGVAATLAVAALVLALVWMVRERRGA